MNKTFYTSFWRDIRLEFDENCLINEAYLFEVYWFNSKENKHLAFAVKYSEGVLIRQNGKINIGKSSVVHILTMRYVHFTVFSRVWNRHSVQISVLCRRGWRHVPRISRRGLSTRLQTYYSEILWKWLMCTTMVYHNVGQGTISAFKPQCLVSSVQ